MEQERGRFPGQAQTNPQSLPKPPTQVQSDEITPVVNLHAVQTRSIRPTEPVHIDREETPMRESRPSLETEEEVISKFLQEVGTKKMMISLPKSAYLTESTESLHIVDGVVKYKYPGRPILIGTI